MATVLTMQDQLTELRMVIDREDPVQVEAEEAFAAMIAKIVNGAEIVGSMRSFGAEQLVDPMAGRMMLGTAEAHDALSQDSEPPERLPGEKPAGQP